MLENENLKGMKEVWEKVSERFKNLSKYQGQSNKDAQTWLSKRFNTKSTLKEAFNNSEIYKFYQK